MKKGKLITAFVLEGLGIWVIIDSYSMGLQALNNPGPGLFPFLLGSILCLLALPICINSLKDLRNADKAKEEEEIKYRPNLKTIGSVTACLIGYVLLLDKLGFLTTTYLLLFGLFWIGSPRKWLFVSISSALMTAAVYFIFVILLKVPFPTGFLR